MTRTAEVIREYGPFPGVDDVGGVTFDGARVWFAAGTRLCSLDPATGEPGRALDVGADAGLTWAEGALWVGQYRDRKIHEIDPETGAIRRTLESNRFVTGVTWV